MDDSFDGSSSSSADDIDIGHELHLESTDDQELAGYSGASGRSSNFQYPRRSRRASRLCVESSDSSGTETYSITNDEAAVNASLDLAGEITLEMDGALRDLSDDSASALGSDINNFGSNNHAPSSSLFNYNTATVPLHRITPSSSSNPFRRAAGTSSSCITVPTINMAGPSYGISVGAVASTSGGVSSSSSGVASSSMSGAPNSEVNNGASTRSVIRHRRFANFDDSSVDNPCDNIPSGVRRHEVSISSESDTISGLSGEDDDDSDSVVFSGTHFEPTSSVHPGTSSSSTSSRTVGRRVNHFNASPSFNNSHSNEALHSVLDNLHTTSPTDMLPYPEPLRYLPPPRPDPLPLPQFHIPTFSDISSFPLLPYAPLPTMPPYDPHTPPHAHRYSPISGAQSLDSDASDVEFIRSDSPTLITINDSDSSDSSDDSDGDGDPPPPHNSGPGALGSRDPPLPDCIPISAIKTEVKQEGEPGGSSASTENKPSTSRDDQEDAKLEEESQCCSICLEPYSNSGKHRIASLKCGHIYGQSCIKRWLRSGSGKKCPNCNAKAHKKDIRLIYARALKPIDTSERDDALSKLEDEKKARRQAELSAAEARLKLEMAMNECKKMRDEMERQQSVERNRAATSVPKKSHSNVAKSNYSSNAGEYAYERTLKFTETGGCRVMAYNENSYTLVVSMPSNNALFAGYGVKKISVVDMKTTQYIPCHSKLIRDISFHPQSHNGLMLTCAIDKKVNVTNLMTNCSVHSFTCDQPLWSCEWDTDNDSLFYVGQQNGTVCQFDIRKLASPIQKLNAETTGSPVVSLQYMSKNGAPYDSSRSSGLLVGQLKSVSYLHSNQNTFTSHLMLNEDNLTYLSVDRKSWHALATYRPTARNTHIKHQLYRLECRLSYHTGGDIVCQAQSMQSVHGGTTQKLLSRSRLIRKPDTENLLLCAGDEASQKLMIWDASRPLATPQLLGVSSPVLDICQFEINNSHYLAGLTEQSLYLHKWIAT